MISISFFLLIAAFVLLLLAGLNVPSPSPRVNYLGLGLAVWVLSVLVGHGLVT